ncbi:hypothetical protein [Viscerimonas tarda]
MKKLALLSLVIGLFATLPVGVTIAATQTESYEYENYTQLPSERAYAKIQQMSSIDQNNNRELRDKPGGGPGLGEIQLPLDFRFANVLVLALTGIAVVVLRKKKKYGSE